MDIPDWVVRIHYLNVGERRTLGLADGCYSSVQTGPVLFAVGCGAAAVAGSRGIGLRLRDVRTPVSLVPV